MNDREKNISVSKILQSNITISHFLLQINNSIEEIKNFTREDFLPSIDINDVLRLEEIYRNLECIEEFFENSSRIVYTLSLMIFSIEELLNRKEIILIPKKIYDLIGESKLTAKENLNSEIDSKNLFRLEKIYKNVEKIEENLKDLNIFINKFF